MLGSDRYRLLGGIWLWSLWTWDPSSTCQYLILLARESRASTSCRDVALSRAIRLTVIECLEAHQLVCQVEVNAGWTRGKLRTPSSPNPDPITYRLILQAAQMFDSKSKRWNDRSRSSNLSPWIMSLGWRAIQMH